MLGQVMSRGEVVDAFMQLGGLREECAWEIAGSLAADVLETLDDDGLLAVSGELLSEHIERMQKLNLKHECMRPGEEIKA
jgi:hypothetical protein